MCKQLKAFRKQEGFTLIELMIVVAIIGILAAIAIPNFLTYQLKSRQSEAKVNLNAIKTSQIAFQAEKGCYLGIPGAGGNGAVVPATGTKSNPLGWPDTAVGGTYPPSTIPAGDGFCVPAAVGGAAIFTGVFTDIGFVASGNVNYWYAAQGEPAATALPIAACFLGAVDADGTANLGDVGFNATASSNLDGDNGISWWASSSDQGSQDCTSGVY
jgi:type IV pilus assembly protein PilA